VQLQQCKLLHAIICPFWLVCSRFLSALFDLLDNAASRDFGLGTGRCFSWHIGRRQAALVRCSSTLDLTQLAMPTHEETIAITLMPASPPCSDRLDGTVDRVERVEEGLMFSSPLSDLHGLLGGVSGMFT
jgi:hypothetical protein